MRYFACFDIGGTDIKFGVLSENADFITKSSMPTCADIGPENWMPNIVKVVEDMKAQYNVCGICISSTAMIDSDRGTVVYSLPKVADYTGFKIKTYLEKACNLPCEVENDVNCVVLAESISGAGKDYSTVLGVAIGTGVGGGFCDHGKILHGATYSACEVGYIKVGNSTFENTGSTLSLCKRVADAKKDCLSNWTGKNVVASALAGDKDCINAIEDFASCIAQGLASLTYVLNPQVIILGGGIMNEQSLIEKVRSYFRENVNDILFEKTKIVHAKYGNDAGMIGALYHFLQKH